MLVFRVVEAFLEEPLATNIHLIGLCGGAGVIDFCAGLLVVLGEKAGILVMLVKLEWLLAFGQLF